MFINDFDKVHPIHEESIWCRKKILLWKHQPSWLDAMFGPQGP